MNIENRNRNLAANMKTSCDCQFLTRTLHLFTLWIKWDSNGVIVVYECVMIMTDNCMVIGFMFVIEH